MRTWDEQGGSAFPFAGEDASHIKDETGMSLRDWFAGQALSGMLSSAEGEGALWLAYAKDAYAMADAMLNVRKRG